MRQGVEAADRSSRVATLVLELTGAETVGSGREIDSKCLNTRDFVSDAASRGVWFGMSLK